MCFQSMIKFTGLTEGGRNVQTVQRTKYILTPSNTISIDEHELIPVCTVFIYLRYIQFFYFKLQNEVLNHIGNNSTISVNELGKQLLKAAANGEADEIKKLLSKGAPFTADWVSTDIFSR